MHQRDENFFVILNKMQTNNQISDDLAYINAHCVCPTPNDPTFLYLFKKKNHVAKHKKLILSLMPEK